MTRLWAEGAPISVETNSDGCPTRFAWRGRVHRLQRIQQRWQVDTDWWSDDGHVWRDYLAVVTADGLLCVLYYDMLAEGWYLAKLYD